MRTVKEVEAELAALDESLKGLSSIACQIESSNAIGKKSSLKDELIAILKAKGGE